MLDQQTASRAKNLLESIRAYDDAMVSWLGNYFYKDKDDDWVTVFTCFKSPMRAFSKNDLSNPEHLKIIKSELPRISVWRTGINFDPSRFNCNYLTRLKYNASKTSIAQMKFPIPISLSYQVDIWSRYRGMMQLIQLQVLQDLISQPPMYLSILFGSDLGQKLIPAFLDGQTDNSDLEPGERLRRIRQTLDIRLDGWIFALPEWIDTVLFQHLEMYDVLPDPDVKLGTIIQDYLGGLTVTEP